MVGPSWQVGWWWGRVGRWVGRGAELAGGLVVGPSWQVGWWWGRVGRWVGSYILRFSNIFMKLYDSSLLGSMQEIITY